MKCAALVLPGLEKICRQEIKELLDVPAIVSSGLVEFSAAKEALLQYASRAQAVRRILITLGKCKQPDVFKCDPALPWGELFPKSFSFKIDVENVKGQDNRETIAKEIATKLFSFLEPQKVTLRLEMKKPEIRVIVYFTGKEYLIGIDLCGELDSRHYRVFTHQASLKGDLAYALVRSSGIVPGDKLVVGFIKDGTLGIEAALYASGLPVHKIKSILAPLPLFAGCNLPAPTARTTSIYGFDESSQNIVAAQKNSLLAGTSQHLQLRRHSLEELDLAGFEAGCDRFIFHLTAKDEGKINELYRQVQPILKPKGTLLIFSTSLQDLPVPQYLKLKKKLTFQKGESKYVVWVMERKK